MAGFTAGDLLELGDAVTAAWRSGVGRDWSAPAGTLEWSSARTAAHAVDAVMAPAFFLASRRRDRYPTYGVASPGEDADPATLIEALATATRVLAAVVSATPPEVRAVIWRRPRVETRGPADFAPRGALELILHGHDVCAGLGVPLAPPAGPCDRLRRHTRDWPHWSTPGWRPLRLGGDPWRDLLQAAGRTSVS